MLHPRFIDQLERLVAAVDTERAKRPGQAAASADARLLATITALILDEIPRDPGRRDFRQGDTLGKHRKHWFRAKFGNGRFRLFFRYRSDVRLILYVWVNDEESLRTYGSRSDAYAVFRGMLDADNPPDDWHALVAAAQSDQNAARAARLVNRLRDA